MFRKFYTVEFFLKGVQEADTAQIFWASATCVCTESYMNAKHTGQACGVRQTQAGKRSQQPPKLDCLNVVSPYHLLQVWRSRCPQEASLLNCQSSTWGWWWLQSSSEQIKILGAFMTHGNSTKCSWTSIPRTNKTFKTNRQANKNKLSTWKLMKITTEPKLTKLLSSDLQKINKQPDKQQIQPCKATLGGIIFPNMLLVQGEPFQLGADQKVQRSFQ